MKKIILVIAAFCLVVVGCKKEVKEETKKEVETVVEKTTEPNTVAENLKEVSFKISGMTCEVGCAKAITSKLCKREGVVDANVVFTDSIATVRFDAAKTNEKDLRTFVESIGDKIYKTCDPKGAECSKNKEDGAKKTACGSNCKKGCCDKKETIACNKDCKKECCTEKKAAACKSDCKKECCKNA